MSVSVFGNLCLSEDVPQRPCLQQAERKSHAAFASCRCMVDLGMWVTRMALQLEYDSKLTRRTRLGGDHVELSTH